MAGSKKYDLDYLLTLKEDEDSRPNTLTKPFTSTNRLTALFPVQRGTFKGTNNPWAFQCLCGEYCVQDGAAVRRGLNKSCGCLRASNGRLKGVFSVIRKLISQDKYRLVQIGSASRARDWGFECKDCGVNSCTLSSYEVLSEDRKFCRCSTRYVCNSSEAKDDLLNHIGDTIWDIYKWDDNLFKSKNTFYVDVKCKVCSDVKPMLYGNILKKGCYSCANIATSKRLQKDTKWFVEEATKVHNGKYDYSLVDYKSAKTHVDIICHEHGEPYVFSQSPDNHKNKGKGCDQCKRLNLRHVHFHLSRVEAMKEDYESRPSGVYLLNLKDDIYKIGVSYDVYKRSLEIDRSSPFEDRCTTVVFNEMNLYKSIHLEHNLHKLYKAFNVKFTEVWEGHSECFKLTTAQVKEIKIKIQRGYV